MTTNQTRPIIVNKDIVVVLSILFLCLVSSLYYSFSIFEITSDSLREYITYLKYVQMAETKPLFSFWWRPITDTMLSTCIWTTYLPASIQHISQLENTETVYRVVLGILSAPLPALMYIVARKYTNLRVAIACAGIVLTSYYFNGFAMYARLIVSMSWILLLLYSMHDHGKYRWWFMAISVAGLLTAHYSTAFVFMFTLLGALGIAVIVKLIWRHKENGLTVTAAVSGVMAFGIVLYYALVSRYARVWNYIYTSVGNTIKATTGWIIPADPVPITVPADKVTYFDAPLRKNTLLPPVAQSPITQSPAVSASPKTADVFSLNPLSGNSIDFVVAKISIILRSLFVVVALIALFRRNKWDEPLPYLCLVSIFLSMAGMWLPSLTAVLGSVRMSFISLPIELLTINSWHGKSDKRNWVLFLLLTTVLIYH